MLKAVILAAGNGTRMRPLTLTKPKPLMRVSGKTALEHNLDQLDELVEEVIIIIGYKGDMIQSLIGEKYKKMKVRYVRQEKQLGTGDAAKKACAFLNDRFILLCGDDIYGREDIEKTLSRFPSISLGKTDNPSSFGVVECVDNYVYRLTEKPKKAVKEAFVNTGLYFLPKSIFNFKINKSKRGEYEFTDYIRKLISEQKLYFKEAEKWIPISYPWDLLQANEMLLRDVKKEIKGKVESGCSISGRVKIEKGAVIRGGSYIEGPVHIKANAKIGPNSFIRGNTVIGEGCTVGNGVEIKNSIVGDNTFISHLNYVGDSIIGNNCNLGGGTILANLRFDKANIKVKREKEKIDTKRNKFGAVIGDNVSIGVNCSVMPGIVIGPGAIIGPHLLVKENIESNTKYF